MCNHPKHTFPTALFSTFSSSLWILWLKAIAIYLIIYKPYIGGKPGGKQQQNTYLWHLILLITHRGTRSTFQVLFQVIFAPIFSFFKWPQRLCSAALTVLKKPPISWFSRARKFFAKETFQWSKANIKFHKCEGQRSKCYTTSSENSFWSCLPIGQIRHSGITSEKSENY